MQKFFAVLKRIWLFVLFRSDENSLVKLFNLIFRLNSNALVGNS